MTLPQLKSKVKELLKNKEFQWSIALAILLPMVWTGIAPEWYSWYKEDESFTWIKWLYNILDGRCLINIPICIMLGYFWALLCNRIYKDNNIRPFRFALAIVGLFFLCWDNHFSYARIIWILDYRMFF
ncbi:MAG: hypothetical protein Q4A64_02030, partial [Porphyromonadaceae bacterium]|nr:hypothetical protein [Porphyromonadaceae bacterium]